MHEVTPIERDTAAADSLSATHMNLFLFYSILFYSISLVCHYRKLEYAAQHYTRMVTWQLQHNREQHELRLQRLRNFISTETACSSEDSNSANSKNSSGGTGTWIDRIQQLVASEKIKLLKQLESARLRLQGAEKEVDVLKALNVSLLNNQVEWQKRLETAKGNVQVYQNTVIKAANKVKTLMQKLDDNSAADSAIQSEGLKTGGTGTKDSTGIVAPSSSTNIFHHSAG